MSPTRWFSYSRGDGARTTFRIPLPVWQLVHFATWAHGMKHVVSRWKSKQTTCFNKPFHLFFLVPSMLRCLGGFETNSLDAKNVPPPKTIYDRIVCIPNRFRPNPDPLSIALINGPMLAAQTARCRLWRKKMATKIKASLPSKVQENKQVMGNRTPAIFFFAEHFGVNCR